MEINSKNILEELQGNWNCTEINDSSKQESINYSFSLLISENLISCNGDKNEYWPSICNFESVGSLKDGYFYREDGSFLQIKSLIDNKLQIELSFKNENGDINPVLFQFKKELEETIY
ncbi:hypothetical protein [Marivirga arenosa]|uniref:Uncharacterized protein n=1 Tax=Marivirga arenosa TaxID=3059076 RepID=A0AA49JAM4_9BACT|nr:hypothetical protein [Marivirga sp. BKB1-2]WKK82971.2 hypothetical protein QYS47_13800 [Marivirga sp. BKB1-2]